MARRFTDDEKRDRLQKEVNSLHPDQLNLAYETIKLIKAGRTIISPAPKPEEHIGL